MSGTLAPRVVIVSRRSELDELLAARGTRLAAAHFLQQRDRSLDEVTAHHAALQTALTAVSGAIPAYWRRGHIDRDDLSRFLFGPEDIVVAVGQDGLVANVAKYLDGQPVIGVDPEPGRNPGVLVQHRAGAVARLLLGAVDGSVGIQERTMVRARLDDGQTLTGLNEIYVGHASHQSARYVVSTPDGRREQQSSSGVVISTGTGATGWCASIARGRDGAPPLPDPVEPALCWFVREAWPSPATGVSVTAGRLARDETLDIAGDGDGLVIFADGIEADRLELAWGQRVSLTIAEARLRVVCGGPGQW